MSEAWSCNAQIAKVIKCLTAEELGRPDNPHHRQRKPRGFQSEHMNVASGMLAHIENKMPKHDHHKAAGHHDDAAKAHREAAEAHEKGNEADATQHSRLANDYSAKAHEASQSAHNKAKGPKKL